VAPPIPSFQGPAAEVKIVTSTLKSRSMSNPEESARFTVYRKTNHEMIGSEVLTAHQTEKSFKLPTEVEFEFKFFKITELMGVSMTCVADTVTTLMPEYRYRVVFDFDFNYDTPRASTCRSEIQVLAANGQIVQRIPPDRLTTPVF
jgi:hypothetical protein